MVSFVHLNYRNQCKISLRSQSLLVTWQKSFGLKLVDSDRFHANIGIASNFCNGVKCVLCSEGKLSTNFKSWLAVFENNLGISV